MVTVRTALRQAALTVPAVRRLHAEVLRLWRENAVLAASIAATTEERDRLFGELAAAAGERERLCEALAAAAEERASRELQLRDLRDEQQRAAARYEDLAAAMRAVEARAAEAERVIAQQLARQKSDCEARLNGPMKSNLVYWQEMQENDYFENHPCYQGLIDQDDAECDIIEWFTPLSADKKVVVIGCGYGRESVYIARRVGHVYGIDVSKKILDKAVKYTGEKGVTNFTPILAEGFASAIPNGIDLVFSVVVFQHLTRDLARNYLDVLGGKLAPDGKMVIQFCEDFNVEPDNDAELKTYEPSVSYSVRQVVDMIQPLGLKVEIARSYMATKEALWHWVCLVCSHSVATLVNSPAVQQDRAGTAAVQDADEDDLTRDETVPEFWDRAHRNNTERWLSGYSGAEIWQRLDVTDRIRHGAVVLNVGVGLGHCTRALYDAGCQVHALDISPVALDRVRDFATVWQAGEADRLPSCTFDVALSHLVAQHMTDADLVAQIRAVLQALKRSGVFAMQFRDENGPRLESDIAVKDGSVARSPNEMAALVASAGGVVARMIERERYGAVQWWVVWIVRPSAKQSA